MNYYLFVWTVLTILINSALFFVTSWLTPFFAMVRLPIETEGIIFGITYGFVLLGLVWKLIVDSMKLHTKN